MRFLTLAILSVAVALSSAASAGDGDSRADKLVCKTAIATGSRVIKERFCMTRKQWDELAYETQKKHVDLIDTGAKINTLGTFGGGGGVE